MPRCYIAFSVAGKGLMPAIHCIRRKTALYNNVGRLNTAVASDSDRQHTLVA